MSPTKSVSLQDHGLDSTDSFYNKKMRDSQQTDRKRSNMNYFEHKKRRHRTSSSCLDRKQCKPEFDDAQLYCDDCQKFYDNICPYHRQTYIPDKKISKSSMNHSQPISDMTCPDGLAIRKSTISKAGKGVFALKQFEKNTFFGPYTGKRHSNFKSAQESGYAWSISDKHGKMIHIIDGYDPNNSNWMRYINCPNTIEQQNLLPIQYDRNMFYKTMRKIRPGEELFVYYGDDYARFLGIKPFSTDYKVTESN